MPADWSESKWEPATYTAMDRLPIDDWRALADLPEAAAQAVVPDADRVDRWERAGIIDRAASGRHRITNFGHGVIAAARVLVPRYVDPSLRPG